MLTGTRGHKEAIQKLAEKYQVGASTIYRWKQEYLKTGTVSSLVPKFKDRGGAKKRDLMKRMKQSYNLF